MKNEFESGVLYARRIGSWCFVQVAGLVGNGLSDSWATQLVATLPEGMRPKRTVDQAAMVQGHGAASCVLEIGTSGNVYVAGKGGMTAWGSWVFAAATFPVE